MTSLDDVEAGRCVWGAFSFVCVVACCVEGGRPTQCCQACSWKLAAGAQAIRPVLTRINAVARSQALPAVLVHPRRQRARCGARRRLRGVRRPRHGARGAGPGLRPRALGRVLHEEHVGRGGADAQQAVGAAGCRQQAARPASGEAVPWPAGFQHFHSFATVSLASSSRPLLCPGRSRATPPLKLSGQLQYAGPRSALMPTAPGEPLGAPMAISLQ